MAVNFETTTPKALLASYKEGIAKGRIVTWLCDKDGDFTHDTDQWRYRAWLRPVIYEGRMLTLNIIVPNTEKQPLTVYSIYHGRFIESMLAHCRTQFKTGSATALPTNSDNITIAA